ncbi:outer membrane beta-barrel protein [Thalassotalea litorea]|uniref:outer membrane beta-barrel protein n=1 Tax=Thalassotalea litorea TaxID=2020715 RepID=UPI001485156C|nr:outer membrane beta-barrel protein [Thalassotalea litorea]
MAVATIAASLLPLFCRAEIPKSPIPFYIGTGVGSSSYDYPNNDLESRSIDKSGFYYQLFAGYPINKYFAIEAGFADLSKLEEVIKQEFPGTTDKNVNLYRSSIQDNYGFRLGVKASLPLTSHFALYGKASFFNWHSTIDQKLTINYYDPAIADVNQSESYSDSGTDGHYAIGIQGTKERLSIFIEHELYQTEIENIYGVNLGVSYRF